MNRAFLFCVNLILQSSSPGASHFVDCTLSTVNFNYRMEFPVHYAAGVLLMAFLVYGQKVGPYNVYPQPNNYGKRCGLPIVVPTVPDPQPERIAGTWYKYRQLGGPVTVNQYLDYHPLGRTGLPFSTVQAEAIWVQIPQYDTVNSTECGTRFWIGLFGVDGRTPGQNSRSNDGYIPVQGNLNGLYFDYANVFIVYGCRAPNYVSGMCDQPVIHVITRKRPDKMAQSELEYLDNLVNQVFAPYCLTALDIPRQLFTDQRPFCPMIPLPECIQKTIVGLSIDVQNSVTR